MNEENEFSFSNENSFKKSKSTHYSNGGFGKSVFVPFVSGIVGATLVVGTCFGVPSIKNKLIKGNSANVSVSSSSTASFINIAEYSETASSVAEKVLPSVVGIKVNYQISSIFGSSTSSATGSGIIISEDGYILTNNHVVSSEGSSSYYAIEQATGITVKFYNDDKEYDATIIGTDPYTDLAVLKVEKEGLTAATLGNSNDLKVGEFVMAIGNPLGMDYSVTSGIVSAVNREVESDGTTYTAIQTDAAINNGNSGGALVNANGEVIGINTMKLAGTGIEGIGFAIPISSTTNIVQQLIEFKTVKRPYIGIAGSSVGSQVSERYNIPEGIYVEEVEKDSPADKAGLKKSDIITKIAGQEVKSVNELNKIKYTYNIGDTVTLTVYREGAETEIDIKLAETPEQEENQEEQPNYQNGNSSQQFDDGYSLFDYFFR